MGKDKPFWMPDTQGFLAIAILTLVGSVVLLLLLRPIQLDDKVAAVLNVALGVLLGNLKDVYSFFFGSSKGSEKKDDALISSAVAAPVILPTEPTPKP